MHWYDWTNKSKEDQEQFKKQSQQKICPDCQKYPCLGDRYLEAWVCIDCGAIKKKEKEENKK